MLIAGEGMGCQKNDGCDSGLVCIDLQCMDPSAAGSVGDERDPTTVEKLILARAIQPLVDELGYTY